MAQKAVLDNKSLEEIGDGIVYCDNALSYDGIVGINATTLNNKKENELSVKNSELLNGKVASSYELKFKIVTKTINCNIAWANVYYGSVDFASDLPNGSKIINIGVNGDWYLMSLFPSGNTNVNFVSPVACSNRSQNFYIIYI